MTGSWVVAGGILYLAGAILSLESARMRGDFVGIDGWRAVVLGALMFSLWPLYLLLRVIAR